MGDFDLYLKWALFQNLGFELGLGWTGLGSGLGGMGNKGCRLGLDKKFGCCGCWSVAYCIRMGNTLNLR